jgi:hypothetical protein
MSKIIFMLLAFMFFMIPAFQSSAQENKMDAGSLSKVLLIKKFNLALPHAEIVARLQRYEHAELELNLKKLDFKTVATIKKLVEAADIIDSIFWDQVSEDGLRTYIDLTIQSDSMIQDYATFMAINYGPWDRMKNNEIFIGNNPKPDGANFYTPDISVREFEQWLSSHPQDKDLFTSPYTVIRRKEGGLIAIKYSQKYGSQLEAAAKNLKEAAAMTECSGLKNFLLSRADSFLNDNYFDSELLWLDTGECPIEVVIGPYEFYEDSLLGYKTAFEAMIMLKDYGMSGKIVKMSQYMDELVKNLPLPENLKGRMIKIKQSPITVANMIYSAGDARAGSQIRAFMLPNDEKVRAAKGAKHVILKNVIEAKFEHLLKPIAKIVISEDQIPNVNFESYFNILLMWELAHGIAPSKIKTQYGVETEPRLLLKQKYTIIESARAEAVALLNHLYLVEKGVFSPAMELATPVTYLASLFETFRFGTTDSRAIAKLIIFNYLASEDAFHYDASTKRYSVEMKKLRPAIRKIAEELLTIEAEGNYEAAGKIIVEYGLLPNDVRGKISDLSSLPVDILPVFKIKEK